MNDRIHRALDGELKQDLTPAESRELNATRALLDSVIQSIPSTPYPPLGDLVLDRIKAESNPQPATNLKSWLWSTRRVSISLRPAYVIGLAAMLAVVIGISSTRTTNPAVAAATTTKEVLVHFKLEAPNAASVALAGDFSNWAPSYSMQRTEPGIWTIVIPLTPGVHDYSFIVDGNKWVPDPAAPAMADGFGGMNSRIAVLASDTRRSL